MGVQAVMSQILFLLSFVLAGLLIHRISRIELTLSCLLAGVIAGILVPLLNVDTGIRASNIHDLVFYIVLPVLIFEAAWHIQPGIMKKWLLPILLLATVGVMVSCVTVAVIVYYLIGEPTGFPWEAALLTGAILAATDPIAVVATLKKLKAPKDLATLIEGESLFNDATAVVLFGVVLMFATAQVDVSASAEGVEQNYFVLFVTVFLGGLLVGALMGVAGALLVKLLVNDSASSVVLLFLAFASFYVAEHLLHVSGILSVMNAAIVSRVLLKKYETTFISGIVATWDWLGLLFNALIFVLMGLVITFDMFTQQWLAIAIAIAAALSARLLAVLTCGALSKATPRPLPMSWQYILFWGGLKGAIAIVLVLSLPLSLPYWWTIQSMVFGVVLFTLLVQGSTSGFVIKRLQ